jgi:formylglycine-generating enzyme required for sulfatase activity
MDWTKFMPWVISLAGLVFGIFQYLKRKQNKKMETKVALETKQEFDEKAQEITAGDARLRYCRALKNKLGNLELLGSPDIKSKIVKLEDAFVSLSISQDWRCEDRVKEAEKAAKMEQERYLSPEEVMRRAFRECRLLVVIGDPGSGKTTLLKYYVVTCLDEKDKKYKKLGFSQAVLPLYFPLRELEFDGNDEPTLFPDNLSRWAQRFLLNIDAQQFLRWLREEKTLVLLDGLDEISSKERRQNVCRWIESMCSGLEKARFVVTSRATGYRKLDGIELGVPHLRADIMDFSPQQQELFLKKWFKAVYLSELQLADEDVPKEELRRQQENLALQKSGTIIDFLNQEDNQAIRQLAAVPMLLQIMAIIWKDHQHLPESRSELYDAALNYLLDYRDRRRKIKPVLRAEKARLVLAPTALWMQEKLKKDEISKIKMHQLMQPILNKLSEQPQAPDFCENLRDRAGLIIDYDNNHYIFRHKSFREFLAGLQLVKEAQQPDRMNTLINYFNEDWWEEALRFFMSKSDDEMFDRFMQMLFLSPVSRQLDDNKQTLLKNLVIEAPQKKIDALADCLDSDELNDSQKRYVLDCLKTIGTTEALDAVKKTDKTRMDKSSREYAEDIISEAAAKVEPFVKIPGKKELETLDTFRNSIEGGVEYIKIPGGTYKYSVTGKMETVPDLYFCKYPVTNQRYRSFIVYLQGKDKEFEKMLPMDTFAKALLNFAGSIAGYSDYLGKQTEKWREKFRSYADDDKKYNGDDQPVVAVTWYAARAYCFWLSCLDAVLKGNNRLEDIKMLSGTYRLPTEVEWEWAAGGNPDGSMRTFPWSEEKGEPSPNLANFNNNVGATTPVGRYPEGATPHGLMDMAGNVWEWMKNLYQEDKPWPAFRGGSWYNDVSSLRCAARDVSYPAIRNDDWGFRVVRSQS